MLARLLAFACLFVFNCQLYAKSVALGGSRRVQLGRETRLFPGRSRRGGKDGGAPINPPRAPPPHLRPRGGRELGWGRSECLAPQTRDPVSPLPNGPKAAAGSWGRPGRGGGGSPRSRCASRGGRRGLQPPGAGALAAAFPQVVLPENQMPSQAFQTPRVKQDHRRSRGCRICKSLPFHLGKERGLRMGCIKNQKPISAALQS